MWPPASAPRARPARGQADLLEVATRRAARGPLNTVAVGDDIAWSPDSRYIAVSEDLLDEEGPVAAVYDTRLRGGYQWSKPARSGIAWSPDGRIVAWRDHATVTSLAFSPDGSLLASGGDDGSVVLRDVATGTRYGAPLVASPHERVFVTFDDSGQLVVATADGGLWRWDVRRQTLLRRACAIAGRNLTHAEWNDLQTGQPYIRACP